MGALVGSVVGGGWGGGWERGWELLYYTEASLKLLEPLFYMEESSLGAVGVVRVSAVLHGGVAEVAGAAVLHGGVVVGRWLGGGWEVVGRWLGGGWERGWERGWEPWLGALVGSPGWERMYYTEASLMLLELLYYTEESL